MLTIEINRSKNNHATIKVLAELRGPMQPIGNYLNFELVQQVRQLDELNYKLKNLLPDKLKPHCSVGSFYKGCLTIVLHNTLWATELRYALPELRDKLRSQGGLYQLSNIKMLISSNSEQSELQKPIVKKSLSAVARASIEGASKLCDYEPLKSALLNLAKV